MLLVECWRNFSAKEKALLGGRIDNTQSHVELISSNDASLFKHGCDVSDKAGVPDLHACFLRASTGCFGTIVEVG